MHSLEMLQANNIDVRVWQKMHQNLIKKKKHSVRRTYGSQTLIFMISIKSCAHKVGIVCYTPETELQLPQGQRGKQSGMFWRNLVEIK